MVKKSINNILNKKMAREIKSNFKQFLSLIIIALIAVCLYVGLASNAENLKQRVDKLYNDGNMADIFLYVEGYDKDDFNAISQIEGVDKVEKRFYLNGCEVYDSSGTIMIHDDDSTLCGPATLKGKRGVVIDELYADNREIEIGDDLLVSVPYSVYDYVDEDIKRVIDLSDGFLKDGVEVNPFKKELAFSLEITGMMSHPELVERKIGHGSVLIDESLFFEAFKNVFIDSFVSYVADIFYEQIGSFSLTNQYLVSVKDGYDVDEVEHQIYRYYNPGCDGPGNSLIDERLWGKYQFDDHLLEVKDQYMIFDGDIYQVTSINQTEYKIKKVNSSETYQITFYGNAALINIDGVESVFKKDLDSNFITSLTKANLPATAIMEQDIYQAKQLCIVFPTIFFIVATLVILTSLSQTIYRSRQEIGTMKALGIPNRKIMFHYISLGVVLSLIGSSLGAIIGPLLIPNILNIKYNILYNLPPVELIYPPESIILCVGGLSLLAGLVTYGVTRSEIKLKPVESMRPKLTKALKTKRKRIKKAKSNISLALTMAFRNIFSKKSRMFMVVFGVLGCTSLTVAAFGIIDTINYGLDVDFNENYQSDVMVTYPLDDPKKDEILEYDGIYNYQEFSTKIGRFQHGEITKNLMLYVYERSESNVNAYSFLDDVNKGFAIASSIAKQLDIKVGDEVDFYYLNNTYKIKVDTIYDSSYWLFAYTFKDNLPELSYSPIGANFNVREGIDQDALAEQLKENLSLSTVVTLNQYNTVINDTLSSVKTMTNTVKIFAILLAVVVTYNLASLNFLERKRDIATLKVLGFSSSEIGLSFVFEIIFLSIIGSLLGLLGGYPLLCLILEINQTTLFNFLYHINDITYLIAGLISFGSAIIVNIYLAILASKVDAVSALKSVE